MKVLVTGDRNWGRPLPGLAGVPRRQEVLYGAHSMVRAMNVILGAFCRIYEENRTIAVLAHGGAPGADTMAGGLAESIKIPVKCYPADWAKHGKAAGPIRNTEMLWDFRPDLVLAFHDDLEASKGTKHMVSIARKAGVTVWLFGSACEYQVVP